jgi:ATP-dependent Zn protease
MIKARSLGPVLAIVSLPLFAQPETPQDPWWLTALITWAPFLFLIGLWIFFFRKNAWSGKGGYREYMQVSQEKLVRIEAHLADIAASLRKIAERER